MNMDHENNIEQKAAEAFDRLTNPKRLQASDDFFAKVQAKIEATPQPATIHTFTWRDSLKYAALLAIMALNGVLLFQVTSTQATSELADEEVSTLVDEFFPDYYTVNED